MAVSNVRMISKPWTTRLLKVFYEVDRAKKALEKEPIHNLNLQKRTNGLLLDSGQNRAK